MQVMCLSGETLGRYSQKAHEVKKVFDKKLLPHGMFVERAVAVRYRKA